MAEAGEGVDVVGDERDKEAGGAVAAEGGDGVVELRAGESVALEIDSAEAVDLKIEEAAGGHGGAR